MQINKKIIICSLLVLTIFLIVGSASASDSPNETSTIHDNEPASAENSQSSLSDTDTNHKDPTNNDNKKTTSTNQNEKYSEDETETQNTIYVSTKGLDTNDGRTKENATTLNQAIRIAQNGSTIYISNGTYKTQYLGTISNNINITGEDEVILDGDNRNRILYIGNTSNVVIKNIIMINGNAPSSTGESGALLGNSGNLTVINCTFANSSSNRNGGAIYNSGNLIVIDSIFENNTADECGGAIFTQSSSVAISSLIVKNSSFKNNIAIGHQRFSGGAIFIQSAILVNITDTIFENNKAIDYGGGAIEIIATPIADIDNCTFINNSANGELYKEKSDYGGGAISFQGVMGDKNKILNVTNSLFVNNSVNNNGGGAVFAMYSKVYIQNSVLINNTDKDDVSLYRRTTDIDTADITANYNWWGSNDNPKSKINKGTISRWIILTISNESEIIEGQMARIKVDLNSYTTGSVNGTLTSPITIERPLLISTNLGDIEGKLINGEFEIDYTLPSGLKIISIKVDDEEQVLFVITTSTSLELSDITANMGNRVEYSVKVKTDDETIVNTGNVEIYFDNDLVATIPVVNGEAKDTIMIGKSIGNYIITAKFIDLTQEFEDKEETASLIVNGIDDIVNNETFTNFFDENNVLKSDIPFDEITFEGEFKDLVLTINKKIKLTGNNALFNNTAIRITSDNVNINNILFIADKIIPDINSIIYSEAKNTTIENNKITYNAPCTGDSYVLKLDLSSKSKIINNNINYIAHLGEDIQTIALNAVSSDELLVKNNTFNISIPSMCIADYGIQPYYYGTLNSAGLVIEDSKKLNFDNNTVNINYTDVDSFGFDTINGVHIKFCDNSNITNNNIELKGHTQTYSLYVDGSEHVEISKNSILAESDADQANTISINGKTSVNIEDNNITAIANNVVYPIYLNDAKLTSKSNITNNIIKGYSNAVYGIYTQENKTIISKNNIEVNGNYTMGILSYLTEVIINNNTISSNGSNMGDAISPQPSAPIETIAICTSMGKIEITNNTLTSTGNYTLDIISSNGTIKDNKLKSANAEGDETINHTDSDLIVDNNKSSEDPQPTPEPTPTPTPEPIVKIIAKNVTQIYDSDYEVRITVDGKAVGAGKLVTFKIGKKTYTRKTDKNGYAKIKLNQKPGKYTITITYDKTKTNIKATIQQAIKAKNNIKVKKSTKHLKIKATLKKLNKKYLKNKKLTLKLNGKKYSSTSNNKGQIIFKIGKKAIKKLKKGKKYTYTITYGNDILKRTLIVRK